MTCLEGLREFSNMGGQNLSSALAYRVYTDLQRSKRYTELNKIFNEDLGFIYLIATRKSRTHVFVPQLITHQLNLFQLQRIQLKLEELHKKCIVHLAICDTTSNILYYTITQGFVDNPKNWQKKSS